MKPVSLYCALLGIRFIPKTSDVRRAHPILASSIIKSETKQYIHSTSVEMSLHVRTDLEHTPRSPASSTETYTDTNTSGGRGGPPSDLWPAELSASFVNNAEQLHNASRALNAHPAADQLGALTARVAAIERAQERLAGELAALRSLHAGESCTLLPNAAVASSSDSRSTTAELERRFADMLAAQKLECVPAGNEISVC